MFARIVIANRGEIACRVIRTCRRLGIETVAVFSDADRDALHVEMADLACRVGPAPSRDSYLNAEAVIAAARETGANAVHPGYGFLSENAAFASACAEAGIVFIGPSPEAIEAMGSKSAAKARMERAGVAVLPGYHGEAQDDAALMKAAAAIGFPVLVKPSAGGGGRGMRRVDGKKTMAAALEAARREAMSSFGDDRLLVEKLLERPRHVEVQVFGDRHGNLIHLFERDCSLQRRHQKVVEEAPAPGIDPPLREAMGEAAIAAAAAIGYTGAGTVEFLLEEENRFFFMEMNTRLQVEHPVTEAITGLDLVEWQIRIAAGEALPLAQDDLAIDGHAIEARLYAEDPARGFLPSAGRLVHLRLPFDQPGIRVDTGFREGDEVTAHYDPLLAKIVAHGPDRPAALARLRRALSGVQVVGPATNAAFLAAVAAHPDFAAARVDTGFIDRHGEALSPAEDASRIHLTCAAAAVLLDRAEAATAAARASTDPHSPWRSAAGWRLNGEATQEVALEQDGRTLVLGARLAPGGWTLTFDGERIDAALSRTGRDYRGTVDGVPVTATVVRDGGRLTVFANGESRRFSLHDPIAEAGAGEAPPGTLAAPMPGVVVDVPVSSGQAVRRGDPLMVIEAMKVEHTIRAPADGTVGAVHFAKGERVEEGVELLAFVPA